MSMVSATKRSWFTCLFGHHPPSGGKVVTRLDLGAGFCKSFGLDFVPTVSGISIEVDTTHALNDGKAAAFLQRIEFLG